MFKILEKHSLLFLWHSSIVAVVAIHSNALHRHDQQY